MNSKNSKKPQVSKPTVAKKPSVAKKPVGSKNSKKSEIGVGVELMTGAGRRYTVIEVVEPAVPRAPSLCILRPMGTVGGPGPKYIIMPESMVRR